jgi:uncharacterized protein YqfB (UPF0267 family)
MKNTHFNFSLLLAFRMETHSVFCKVRVEAKKTINTVNITNEHNRLYMSSFMISWILQGLDYDWL